MPFEIQAHRGARAFYPENTIQAFCKAADLGCRVVELDLVASKDHRILVSHDPWITAVLDGHPLRRLFYAMEYREIALLDCGTPSPDFPQQQRIEAFRPLLSEVFREVESHLCRIGLPGGMVYNLEVKSRAGLEGVAFPPPGEYAALVVEEIRESGLAGRVRLQSFDPRVVAEARRLMPELCFGLLVEELSALDGFPESTGFVPSYVNPHVSLVDGPLVDKLHRYGAKVVVWTVNDPEEMIRMRRLGVDGLITDHPETALHLPELSAP
ncbi:MAG: glycerophosphodiester phosphodiesterase [Chlorobiaceae bacterium]|nr:glycerophosphodiester phosphodiesterase [Chlorobiaceae bacterium]